VSSALFVSKSVMLYCVVLYFAVICGHIKPLCMWLRSVVCRELTEQLSAKYCIFLARSPRGDSVPWVVKPGFCQRDLGQTDEQQRHFKK
jgi:hypothetical protein